MPSIGKDLVKIRKHLGLTLQDIQFATKLPQHTLEKIEDDTIFIDAEEGPIYTRNFVRSYGRVLRIDDDILIKALDQREAGNYDHLLLREYSELAEELTDDKRAPSESESASSSKGETEAPEEISGNVENIKNTDKEINGESAGDDNGEKEPEKTDAELTGKKENEASSSALGTSGARRSKKADSSEKTTKEVNWAAVGQKMKQEKKRLPVWVIGLIILAIILAVAGYFIVQSGLLNTGSSSQEEITTPPDVPGRSSLSIELDEQQPQPEITEEMPAASQPEVTLDDTLNIVVYAAFGNVDPVRVWSDTKPRFDPYWIEEGNAMIFDFEDVLQVRGPYDNMLLFFNGHLIENMVQNFYNEEEEYVELLRSDFTSDPKWSEITDLQVPEEVDPPEEIQTRPTF